MVKEETKPATGFTVTSQLNEIKKHTTTRGVFNLRELRAHPEGFKSAADFLHGMELEPEVRQAHEKYHARLVGAILNSVAHHPEAVFDSFDSNTRAIAKNAVRRLSRRGWLDDCSETPETWVDLIVMCIGYMDNPYRLSQEPWRSVGFTEEQRRTLESIIAVRCICGWHREYARLWQDDETDIEGPYTHENFSKDIEAGLMELMKVEIPPMPENHTVKVLVDDKRRLQSIQIVPWTPGEDSERPDSFEIVNVKHY